MCDAPVYDILNPKWYETLDKPASPIIRSLFGAAPDFTFFKLNQIIN